MSTASPIRENSAPPGSATAPPFLGVARSVGGRRWRLRLDDDGPALALARRTGLPEIVARVLAGRGVDADGAAAFLDPRLRDSLPDPSHLHDMDKAALRLAAAIEAGEPIGVFGDYDVDGATSAALFCRFVAAAGGRTLPYIPDRLREGYGPNAPALLGLKARGAKVAVTVDCGTGAHAALEAAAAAGLEIIVVDHHIAEPKLPTAFAVINPNRLDEASPHGYLAAVGVTFLLVVAVNRVLRAAGRYAARPEPDLMALLDLVALGTVCDVVPLVGANRALVVQGLNVMARRERAGMVALADVGRLDRAPEAYHLGFVLGPRVNAGGRVGEADLGLRLLVTDDPREAAELAARLDALNGERRSIEAATLAAALAQLGETDSPVAFAVGHGWHAGVIGIVASRLAERYARPACVVALDGGVGRGSGRSANGVDLGAAIVAARQAGLLVDGGGHRAAAGFTVREDGVDALKAFLAERIAAQTAREGLAPSYALDGALTLAAATAELCESLAKIGPFGAGNAEPRFAFPSVRVARADTAGEDHVRCLLTDSRGGRLWAIAFRARGHPLGAALSDLSRPALHVVGRLRADEWRGETRVQLQIEDVALA